MKRVIILPDGSRIEVEHKAFEEYSSSPVDTVILTTANVSRKDFKELIEKVEHLEDLASSGEAMSGQLEQERIAKKIDTWPEEWGDYLEVSLYGSIEITSDIHIPELGLSISSVKEKGIFAFQDFWTYPCRIEVKSKDWVGLSDAINRLEIFLNSWHLSTCWSGRSPMYGAGCSIHYYCSLLTTPYAIISELENEILSIRILLDGYTRLNTEQRKKVLRAGWWMRQAKHDLLSGAPNTSIFVLYSATWNAFECLVDVACDVKHPQKLTKTQKNDLIREYIENLDGPPQVSDIDHCYSTIVNFSFRDRVRHVFNLITDKNIAEKSYAECFTLEPAERRLYQIRNDIDHGNKVEYDIDTRLRVIEGLERLQKIVLPLFAWLIGYQEHLRNK